MSEIIGFAFFLLILLGFIGTGWVVHHLLEKASND